MSRHSRRGRWLAGAAILAIAAAVVLVVVDPFRGSGTSGSGVADNSAPTTLATVTRRSLASQTQVSGTLGYAGSIKVLVPAGSAPSAVQQAQQSLSNSERMLQSATAALASDGAAAAQLRATLSATRQKQDVDCAGEGAAEAAAAPSSDGGEQGGGSADSCASDRQTVSASEQTLTGDSAKLASDRASLTSAERSVASARAAVVTATSSATLYGQNAVYTALPAVGQTIARTQRLYEIDGQPVLLLYGSAPATRAFRAGMPPGPDVAQLNANLAALGYGAGLTGEAFTAATATAIRALQTARGLDATGELLLGSVVFEPGPVRVTSVTASVGSTVMPGPVIAASTTARQVTVQLDASEQSDVRVGDPVTITLPDGRTTPGTVTYVATVAVASTSKGGEESPPTIEVHVAPREPGTTGRLDQAPVQVSITTASVHSALVVPVDALLALAGGGYAVEQAQPSGAHRLIPVSLGLFDDEAGVVQVSGPQLSAGQRVVVPST